MKLEYINSKEYKLDDTVYNSISEMNKHDLLKLFEDNYVIIAETDKIWNLF